MLQQPVLQQQQAAGVAEAGIVAAAEGGDGPPVGTEGIGGGRWCGKVVWVVSWYVWLMGWPTESRREKTRKTNLQQQEATAHIPSPFSTRHYMGRPVQSPCLTGLAANVMGRAAQF